MALVLFVDDEPYFAGRYVEHLSAKFDVKLIDQASDVFSLLKSDPTLAAIILDVMMPPPADAPPSATQDGVATGVWLLKEIQNRYPGQAATPAMILTNRNPAGVRANLDEMRVNTSFVEVRQKLDTPAFLLPKFLTELIQKTKP